MKPEGWKVQVFRPCGSIKRTQDAPQLGRMGCLNALRGADAVEGFKPFMSEACNYRLIVSCIVAHCRLFSPANFSAVKR